VAGLVLATLHRIPLVGEVFRVGRYAFTVLEADKRRVLTVRVTLTPTKKPTPDKTDP
jgi:CBS domain containing-hemolysin-like protein